MCLAVLLLLRDVPRAFECNDTCARCLQPSGINMECLRARTSHCDLLQTSCQPPPYPVTERVCALLLGCCRGVLFVITFAICDSPGMQPSGTILCPHPRSLAVLRMIKAIAQPWPCMVNAWPMHGYLWPRSEVPLKLPVAKHIA